MEEAGRVRIWHDDEGWGVVDSGATPGGCWVHFSVVRMRGCRRLAVGQQVTFTFEAAEQDGHAFCATEVRPTEGEDLGLLRPPDPGLVSAYWAEQAPQLGLAVADVPDAWAFGGDAEQADRLLELVLSGAKTATSSALWSYEADGDPLPSVGELSILCDGQGRPRALIRLTGVAVTELDEVTEHHAYAEGEGDRTLAYWRRTHEDFFRRHLPDGREVGGSMPVVLETFERLAP